MSEQPQADESIPLCVDLDGTLARTDLLFESFFALLSQQFFALFLLPLWLVRGKAYLKAQIAARVQLDVGQLPLHAELVEYLRQEHGKGRRLVLATASDRRLAVPLADHLGFFSDVFASDGTVNLAGKGKQRRLVEVFGEKGFDYAGNAPVDLAIWRSARRAVVVGGAGLQRRAAAATQVERVFAAQGANPLVWLRALRLHQWLKNLLIFVPWVAAHRVQDLQQGLAAGLAFLAFGLCASSVYLLNDLLDLNADRHHPEKRRRPFAAGTLSLASGLGMIPFLLLAAVAIARLLPIEFAAVLGGYYAITLAYSLYLKRKAMVDVLTLAGLYTVRLVAGGAAVGVGLSFWLLAFSIFFFFSLAMVKRYKELMDLQEVAGEAAKGRGYYVGDLGILNSLGTSSGFMAVLVLALYINSSEVEALYTYPEVIWLLCPLLMYWISRIWLLTQRGEMTSDPVVFAARDGISRAVCVVGGIIILVAI